MDTSAKNNRSEYAAWCNARRRCTNPNCIDYPSYGGRGITMYLDWKTDFPAFLAHVGKKPTPKHTLDRIDNDEGYEPGNVRWATYSEQNKNKRNPPKRRPGAGRKPKLLVIGGRSQTAKEWAEELGMGEAAVRNLASSLM